MMGAGSRFFQRLSFATLGIHLWVCLSFGGVSVIVDQGRGHEDCLRSSRPPSAAVQERGQG